VELEGQPFVRHDGNSGGLTTVRSSPTITTGLVLQAAYPRLFRHLTENRCAACIPRGSARGLSPHRLRRDEEVIRTYIQNQEQEDQRLEQMNLWR
jgi:hypothetical protein